jgi:hypothetical protein
LIYCKNFYKCHPAQQLKKTFLVYINGIIPWYIFHTSSSFWLIFGLMSALSDKSIAVSSCFQIPFAWYHFPFFHF